MTDSTATNETLNGLLDRWSRGDRGALDELLTHLYTDIHAIAVRQLNQERYSSLRPTALVHEAYVKLVDVNHVDWQHRAHFFAVSAQIMRRILLDRARRRVAAKRGGKVETIHLGRVHTTRSASTMRANERKPRKRTSSFSKREKMRRKPLSLRNRRSISLRFL